MINQQSWEKPRIRAVKFTWFGHMRSFGSFWDWFHWKVGIPARASSYFGAQKSFESIPNIEIARSQWQGRFISPWHLTSLTFVWLYPNLLLVTHTHTNTNMVKLEARKPKKTVGHLILSYDPLSGQSDFRLKYSQFPLYLFPSILTCQHTSKRLGNFGYQWVPSGSSALPARNNVPSVFHKQMHLAP